MPIPVMAPVAAPQLLGDIVGAVFTVGTGVTLTVAIAVFLQLFPLVPVTV